jgi:cytoplasmic iron level regulating protein YaaA (DUF328/UPF0246 family)
MLVIISPAKTQNFTSSKVKDFSTCSLLEGSIILIEELKKLSENQIAQLMLISPKLAKLNAERFQNFKIPFNLNNAKQAILAFKGDVYSGIDVNNYSTHDFNFANDHLRIISGLYGVLRPLDLIQPYRLEMKTKLKNIYGDNLYKFWGNKITSIINESLTHISSDILLNLASQEYFSAIDIKHIQAKIITVNFKEHKNGSYKIIAIHAKRARGLMADFVIKNKITKISELYKFNLENYKFNEVLSNDSVITFTR